MQSAGRRAVLAGRSLDGSGSAADAVRAARAGAAAAGEPASSTRRDHRRRPAERARKARLRLTHVDPWSVMKTSFLLSIALGIVTVVAVAVVWAVLGAAGVWDSINATVGDVVGGRPATASTSRTTSAPAGSWASR